MKRFFLLIILTLSISACSGGDDIVYLDDPENLSKPELSMYLSATFTREGDVASETPVRPTRTNTPIPSLTPTNTDTPTSTPTDDCFVEFDHSLNLALLSQINSERAANGLDDFSLSADMQKAAEKHLQDLVCNNILGHIGSDDSTPQDRAAMFQVEFETLKEIVLTEDESVKGIEALLEDDGFLEVLGNPDFKFVGMAYANEQYAGKNGVFVLIFFY